MPNNLEPKVDQWYAHLDKGQRFYVTAFEKEDETVEVQHFDGDVEEFSLEDWGDLNIELSEAPESWSGALDIAEQDDFGTEITDTQPEDWNEPEQDFRPLEQEKLTQDPDSLDDESINLQGSSTVISEKTARNPLVKRADGKYEERLGGIWTAQYFEEPATGLWQVIVLKHDVFEWRASGYSSIEDARRSAQEYYNQV